MKPTLIDQPHDSYASEILKTFENERPLSADQINFLAMHEKILSSYAFDPVIRYYLKGYRDKAKKELAFTLAQQKLTKPTVQHIKEYVQALLKNDLTHVDLKMTLEQFQHFKTIGIPELIFWHGNQFLTNAPFYPGGIPYIIYFQWGNTMGISESLFGVVKLQLTANKLLKGNVHIYFEPMKNRTLYQCIKDYNHQMKLEPTQQNQLIETNRQDENLIHRPSPTLKPFFYEIH